MRFNITYCHILFIRGQEIPSSCQATYGTNWRYCTCLPEVDDN